MRRSVSIRRATWLLVPIAVVPVALASCSSSPTTTAPLPLETYHANTARTGFTADSAITSSNASSLSEKWHTTVAAPISAQSIVDNNVVYWGDWTGQMHATDTSGTSLWSTDLGTAPKPKACPFNLATQGIVSSPTVGTIGGRNLVWVGGGAGQLVALDASTGAIVWSTSLGKAPEYVTWSSPLLYRGSIYEGVASFNDCPVVNGAFYRVNAMTGAIQAVNRLSQQASCIGPGIWSSASADPSDNSIYVTTSNANQRSNPSNTCQLPDSNAILKLDASTLDAKSVWQVPLAQQISDSDFGAAPMLFSATIGGMNRQLVGAVNKNGVYYALDRSDLAAGPVWTYTAEDMALSQAAGSANSACEDINTISSSAWAGPGSPVIVAGLAASGTSCIGTLAALDPSTGQPVWKVPLQGPVLGAVTEVPGLVAVGAGSHVDLLSASTGAQLFSYAEPKTTTHKKSLYGAPVGYFWSPITAQGKYLFASNQDGSLRAFSP